MRQTAIALCAERFGQPLDEQGLARIRRVRVGRSNAISATALCCRDWPDPF